MFYQNTFPKYVYDTDDQPTPAIPATEDDIFDFTDQTVGSGQSEARANKVTIECFQYLEHLCSESLENLNHPSVKQLFRILNATDYCLIPENPWKGKHKVFEYFKYIWDNLTCKSILNIFFKKYLDLYFKYFWKQVLYSKYF